MRDLQAKAREQGLWNLFLPGDDGAGLTNLQYAPVAELTGWSPRLAPAAFNCAAPDTGNMEVLHDFGTPEQKERWLEPLLRRRDPLVVLHDRARRRRRPTRPTSRTRIRRDGDEYVITGRKWWSTGAMNPDAAIFIVMGKTDPDAERHRQQRMILVPRDTPGVRIVRPLTRVRLRRPRPRRPRRDRASTTCACRRRTSSAGEGDGLRDRAGAARARAASTTACARSAWPSAR